MDLGHGLSCKGPHEEIVESFNSILKLNSRAVAAGPRNMYISPIFFAVMGSIFMWFGYNKYEGIQNLSFVMGAAFLVYAIVLFVRVRAIYSRSRA